MKEFLAVRLAQAIFTLLIVSGVVFLLVRLTGDPVLVVAPEGATRAQMEELKKSLGLDQPLPVQYGIFLGSILSGDLGVSNGYGGRPVAELIVQRMPATAELGIAALLIAFGIGIPAGVWSAARHGTATDLIARSFAVVGQAIPTFWQGILLIMIFAVWWDLLPAGGRGSPLHLVLPAFTLGTSLAGGVLRITRSAMLEVLGSDYIKLARINGVGEQRILWEHALRNAMIPILTFGGLILVGVLTGTVVVETVFGWPGLGRLAIDGIRARDFQLVQGVVLFFTAFYVVVSLCLDVLYAYVNPRIRY